MILSARYYKSVTKTEVFIVLAAAYAPRNETARELAKAFVPRSTARECSPQSFSAEELGAPCSTRGDARLVPRRLTPLHSW
jgi:hypothetical protein